MKDTKKLQNDTFISYELGNPKLTQMLSVLQRINAIQEKEPTSEEEVIDLLAQHINSLYLNHLAKTKKEQSILSLTTQILEGKPTSTYKEKTDFEDHLDAIQSGILKIVEKGKVQNNKNILFREIFHSITIGFCIYNPLRRTIGVYNQSFNNFFQLDNNQTDVLSAYTLFDETFKLKLDTFYLSEEKNYQFETFFGGKISKKALIQLNKIKTLEDETENIILFITDLSFQIENEIIKKEKKLVEKNLDLKNTFITYFSNEIVLPLYKIISSLSNPTITQLLSPQQRTDLQTLKYQCQSVNVLIDDVLHDSLLENYADTRALQEVNLLNLTQEVLTTHYFHAISKNVFLDFEIDKEIPSVQMDAVKLSIILNNLIGSSLKLIAKDSKILLRISQVPLEEKAIKLYFEIISFDKNAMQIHPLQTDVNPNLSGIDTYGLGLPISEKLVEYLGGKLEFEATTNTYSFQLVV